MRRGRLVVGFCARQPSVRIGVVFYKFPVSHFQHLDCSDPAKTLQKLCQLKEARQNVVWLP